LLSILDVRHSSSTLAGFNTVDVKHYERAKRQKIRNETILDALRNNGGNDHNTGASLQIHETDEAMEVWTETIVCLYAQLSDEQRFAIATIDGCVHVGVYNNRDLAFVGFNVWMDEMKCESPIYNLTDSFAIPSARPLGATHLSLDLQKRILRGEVIVIICLDLTRMIEAANSSRPGLLELASKRETRKLREQKIGTLELKNQALKLRAEGQTVFLANGFRDRVVFDQQRPTQLLRHHQETLLREVPEAVKSEPAGDAQGEGESS